MIVNSPAESPLRIRWLGFIPSAIWALVILMILLMPGEDFPAFPFLLQIPCFDKLVHAVLFFVLFLLLWLGVRKQSTAAARRFRFLPAIVLICLLYAALTEFLQFLPFTQREPDIFDWLAGTAGSTAGLLFYWMRNRIFATGREK